MIQYFQFIERIIENKKIKKYLIFVLYGLVKKGRLVYNLIHVLFRKKLIAIFQCIVLISLIMDPRNRWFLTGGYQNCEQF